MKKNLSPLDGRYAAKVSAISPIFSEFGLMRYRTIVESRWLQFLSKKGIAPALSAETIEKLTKLEAHFSEEHYLQIKEIEAKTNHDVKAVEYFLQSIVSAEHHSWIHFACTSEDINNTAYGLMLKDGRAHILGEMKRLIEDLSTKAKDWKAEPLLSLTHGQSATPTTLGKEVAVFVHRLKSTHRFIEQVPVTAKINGATGTFSAHVVAVPNADWAALSQQFITTELGLVHNPLTAQIEPHDHAARILYGLSEFSTIMVDLCRDMWGYISRGVMGQKAVAGEVGSSTMPHKVNPIDFENAEGNCKLARGIALTLATELPASRFQRDLTDSTLQRNFGLVFGHMILALKALEKGLSKISPNTEKLIIELQNAPEVLTEAVQTVLRAEGAADAYEQLKQFSRGKALTLSEIRAFIDQSSLSDAAKTRLNGLTPSTYIGLAEHLVTDHI